MSRILSLLLSVVMFFGSLTVAVAADDTVVTADKNVAEAFEMLGALGIVRDSDFTTFETEKTVTRGEFARYIARLVRADENGGNTYFYDVPENHYAYSAVSALAERNIINGSGNKTFKPEEAITLNDACTILIKILSYERYAETSGGYPIGYVKEAGRLDVLKNVSAKEYITMGDALILMKNALLTETMYIESMNGDGTATYKEGGDLLLTWYYDAYYDKGVFSAIENMGVLGGKGLKVGEIEIDGVRYATGGNSHKELFGMEVEYIYTEDTHDQRTLLWMTDYGKSTTLTISSQENNFVFDETNMYFKYYKTDGGKSYTANIKQNVSIIYNGENYSGDMKSLFDGGRCELRLISTDGSSAYDVVIVTKYDIFQVDAVDLTKNILYGDKQQKYELDSSDVDYLSIMNSYSEPMELANIAEKSIAAVAKSVSGNTISILVSDEKVEGAVTKVSNGDNYIEVEIDGKNYCAYRNSYTEKIQVGNYETFYLDAFSYIYTSDKLGGRLSLGFPIAVSENDITPDEGMIVRMLTESGDVSIYNTAKKIRIDGTVYKTPDTILKKLCKDGSVKKKLIEYKLNDKGEISTINTTEGEDGIRLEQSKETVLYKSNCSKLGTKIAVNSDTKIFCVPTESDIKTAENEAFTVRKKSDLVNDKNYMAESYSIGTETGDFADAVVVYGTEWGEPTSWTAGVLIDSKYTALNSDDEVVEAFNGYQGTSQVEMICDSSLKLDGYKSGDIVRAIKNSKGYVTKLERLYEYGKPVDSSNYKNMFNAVRRNLLVNVNDRIGPLVKVGYNSGADYDEVFNLDGKPIVIYDADEKKTKIQKGTYADVLTYAATGRTDHKIFIQCNYENVVMVVIYKD